MDITKVAVIGITEYNWPEVHRVFKQYGYNHCGTYPLYGCMVSEAYEGQLNGWNNGEGDHKLQVRRLRTPRHREFRRLTVARFLEQFDKES